MSTMRHCPNCGFEFTTFVELRRHQRFGCGRDRVRLGLIHGSHKMRYSNSSVLNGRCELCDEGDPASGTNPNLSLPCKGKS